uniref:Uncharacterized protein n=1 Tax=Timema bartmani TaxID=61472 RepID=A0A7R9EVQ4_9NEOP|nr:unnamed protein product [Timema bartmani]
MVADANSQFWMSPGFSRHMYPVHYYTFPFCSLLEDLVSHGEDISPQVFLEEMLEIPTGPLMTQLAKWSLYTEVAVISQSTGLQYKYGEHFLELQSPDKPRFGV